MSTSSTVKGLYRLNNKVPGKWRLYPPHCLLFTPLISFTGLVSVAFLTLFVWKVCWTHAPTVGLFIPPKSYWLTFLQYTHLTVAQEAVFWTLFQLHCVLTRLFPCLSYCEQKSVFLIGIFASCVKSAIVNLLLKNQNQNQGLQNTHTPTHTKQQQKPHTQNQALDPNVLKNFRQFFNLPTCPLCPSSGSKTIFATPSNQPIAINTVPRFWFFWI